MNVRSSRDWLGEETQHGFSFSARCWVNLVEIASAARPAASASRPNVSPARLRLLPTRPTAASSRTMSVLRRGPCEASRRVHFQCIEPAIKAGAQCAFLLHVQPCQQPSTHLRVGFGVKGKGLAHSLPRCMSRSHMRNLALLRWAEVLCLLGTTHLFLFAGVFLATPTLVSRRSLKPSIGLRARSRRAWRERHPNLLPRHSACPES